MGKSILDYLDDEDTADRIASYVYEGDTSFVDFDGFKRTFDKVYNTPIGRHILDKMRGNSEAYQRVWECPTIQGIVRRNSSSEALEQENQRVSLELGRQPAAPPEALKQPKVAYITVVRSGKVKETMYRRAVSRPFKPSQEAFLRVRVQRGVKLRNIVTQFNAHYGEGRSYSSIRNKVYRL